MRWNRTNGKFRNRNNEVLFIDARNMGHLINRRTKVLSEEDIQEIAETYHNWRNPDGNYDIAKFKNPDAPADIIKNWLRSKNTIELLGLWEKLHNPDFKLVEFDQFRNEAGYNHFVLSPQKWIGTTNAIGLSAKPRKSQCCFNWRRHAPTRTS